MQLLLSELVTAVSHVLLGKEQQVKLAIACLIGRGHLLIEDLPGMGKFISVYCLGASMLLMTDVRI